MQNGVINLSTQVDDTTVAYWVDAWDRQAEEIAEVWKTPYSPVVFYTDTKNLPIASGKLRLLTIQDKLDISGAGGYHTDWLGLIFSRILVRDGSVTGSHEIGEMDVDPHCNRWAKMPGGGLEVAVEIADPVEEDTYPQNAKIGNLSTRPVMVSNYVLPSYFDPNGSPPFDRMGKLDAPFSLRPGGYYIVRGGDGVESPVFAGPRLLGNLAAAAFKMYRPEARLFKRMRSA